MKQIYLILAALLAPTAIHADNASTLHISGMNVNKGDEMLTLNMTVDPSAFRLKSNEIVNLTPMVVAGSDTLAMPSVRLAGKQAWYAEVRDGKADSRSLLRAGKDLPFIYSSTVDFPEMFAQSQIVIKSDTVSICNCRPPQEGEVPVVDLDFRPVTPRLYLSLMEPQGTAEKVFNLSGKANVIFKVNRTEIDWSYAGNYAELDTILRTINAVRDNPDATVEAIYLTGYASPEGSYANNVRLAKGRTEAVKDYVVKNSTFPESIYHTSYVPEDWAGLREWLSTNLISNRDEIIAFIDDKTIPEETRNDELRKRFPEEYAFLLKNVYPSLRHTDYRITYKIRSYYDVEEIRQVMLTNPGNLSLNELYLYAASCPDGSPEQDEAYAIAAHLFPTDITAVVNAANSAIRRGDYSEAERFLARLETAPWKSYSLAVISMMRGDYAQARKLLEMCPGYPGAEETLRELDRIENSKGSVILL